MIWESKKPPRVDAMSVYMSEIARRIRAKAAGRPDTSPLPSFEACAAKARAFDEAVEHRDWERVQASLRAIDPSLASQDPATVADLNQLKAVLTATIKEQKSWEQAQASSAPTSTATDGESSPELLAEARRAIQVSRRKSMRKISSK